MLAVTETKRRRFITDLGDDELEERKLGRETVKDLKPVIADLPDEVIGQKIGRYKILERVGEGWLWSGVYVAEADRTDCGVASRSRSSSWAWTPNRWWPGSKRERQALAMMDHPNIAKVLDAGTTGAGRPFFVMELVRGIKLTEYCDENNLTLQGTARPVHQGLPGPFSHAHPEGDYPSRHQAVQHPGHGCTTACRCPR